MELLTIGIMEPLLTAISIVLLLFFGGDNSLARETGNNPLPEDPVMALCLFFGTIIAGALILAAAGRYLIPRLPHRWFTLAFIGMILCALYGVMCFQPVIPQNSPWAFMSLLMGVPPACFLYLGAALGTYPGVGRARGFSLMDWLGLRLFLLPMAGMVCLVCLPLALNLIPFEAQVFMIAHPGLDLVASLALAGLLFVLAPFALRLIFPSEPISGPLGERLNEFAARTGIRYRRILVWKTGTRSIVNACVAGLVPWSRYIFFTDVLLRCLSPDEVEAVFAHELAHVRKRHFPLLILLVLGGMLCFAGLYYWLSIPEGWETSFFLGWFIFFLALPFSRVSRVLELEADLGAVQLGAKPAAMTSALDKLQTLSGRQNKPNKRHGWRHYSIPYRVLAIRTYLTSTIFRRLYGLRRRLAHLCIGGLPAIGIGLVLCGDLQDMLGSAPAAIGVTAAYLEKARDERSYLALAEQEIMGYLRNCQDNAVGDEWMRLYASGYRQADKAAIAQLQRHTEYRAKAYLQLSEIYAVRGDAASARRALKKAKAIDPSMIQGSGYDLIRDQADGAGGMDMDGAVGQP